MTAAVERSAGRLGDWVVRALGTLVLVGGAFAMLLLLVHLRVVGG